MRLGVGERMGKVLPLVISLTFLSILAGTLVIATERSTSPDVVDVNNLPASAIAAGGFNPITFSESEFPLGTYITNQYASYGIIFGGDTPYITTDDANPTTPVLSGSPEFQGAIEGRFVWPDDGVSPVVVSAFSLDAGYFNAIHSTRIEWFDLDGNKLGERTNSILGIEHFVIEGDGIASWRISMTSTDENGFAIDNVAITGTIGLLNLRKTDDVDDGDCVAPDDIYHYTIAFHAGPMDEPNVVITDYLPEGVNFISADPDSGDYYPRPQHQYLWFIGDVAGCDPNAPGDPNQYFTLAVQVNTNAEPLGQLCNKAAAESDFSYNEVEEYTPICCWGGSVIYVDGNAGGYNNGTSWANAYTDLRDAFARAAAGCGNEIWVADGTYRPGNTYSDTFEIPAGVSVYGGYGGAGWPDPDFRNPKQFPTILSGYIGKDIDGYDIRNNTVVKMGQNSLLDGCTVEDAAYQGIDASNVSSTVSNCIVKNNEQRGIYCLNGNLTVRWCEIADNEYQGIWHRGSGYLLDVTNCSIHDNQWDGVLTDFSTSTIINSLIYQNGSGSDYYYTYYGLNLLNPSTGPTIRNNTIVHNVNEGIRFVGTYRPDVRNCILWENNEGDLQLAGLKEKQINYCCIPDCNDINPRHNINNDPKFAYSNPLLNNFHLAADSPCIDNGDPYLSYDGQFDIDEERREMGLEADIGADEIDPDCSDVYNQRDWNADGVINIEEFDYFSQAYKTFDPNNPLCNPNNPGYVSDPDDPDFISELDKIRFDQKCDLDDDLDVDFADIILFFDDWLWTACWRMDIWHNPAIYNELDWNGDGIVNLEEFYIFACAWLSSPGQSGWNAVCDLNDDGVVDLPDLIRFADEWLWFASWRTDILQMLAELASQQGTSPPSQPEPPQQTPPVVEEPPLPEPPQEPNEPPTVEEPPLPEPPQEPNEPPTAEEPSIEQQIADLQDAIQFFETIWETDENIQQEISAEDWQAFMDELYASLAELQSLLPPSDPNDISDPNDLIDPNSLFLLFGMNSGGGGMMSQFRIQQENSVGQQIAELQDSIQFLETIWDENPDIGQEIQAQDWQAFMDSVYKNLTELEQSDIITQDEMEAEQ